MAERDTLLVELPFPMPRVIDSSKFRLLPWTCSRIFVVIAILTVVFVALIELVSIVRNLAESSERSTAEAPTTTKNPLTEIAKDVYLVHTIRDRRNRGEEIRALVWAKAPNYNVECGMRNGIRMRASWYELGDNGPSSSSSPTDHHLYRAFYLTCNLPDIFSEKDLVESLCFVEHLHNDEAPRLGFRITGVDIDYDLSALDPEKFDNFYGLCVPLLETGDFTAEDIVEFVEINRKLGAERITFMFTFIREALSRGIIAALEHYSDDPLVVLVDFSLPFPSTEVFNNGENVARDICLHHHMQTTELNNALFFHCVHLFYHFRLVGFTTLREFFLPLMNDSMTEVLHQFPFYESGLVKISALNVNVKDTTHPLTKTNKFSLDKLDHTATRGIVRPRKVVEMGPHFAYHLVNSGRQMVFENNARHIVLYRLTSSLSDSTVSESTVADQSITDLVPALADVYEQISYRIGTINNLLSSNSVVGKVETL